MGKGSHVRQIVLHSLAVLTDALNAHPIRMVKPCVKHEHQEIVSLERRFWEEADNPKLFKEAFADDGLTIFEPVGYIEKEQAVEMSRKGKPFKDVVMEDVHIRELTPDCIALAYHGQGTRDGDEKPYRGSICSVYVRRKDRWLLALTDHQGWAGKQGEGQSNERATGSRIVE